MTSAPQGFPHIDMPLVTTSGNITQTWLQLLISLWQRTGGGGGGGFAPPNGTYLVQQANFQIPEAFVATNSATVDFDFSVPNVARADVNQAALEITEAQVAGLVSDLANRALTSTQVIAGTGLTGGGPLTGNVTLAVPNNGITNALLAQAAADTLKGNNTGVTADVTDLTVTQVTALLDIFTSLLQGLVPASGGGTANYLRADGGWHSPLSGGISGSVTLAALTGPGTQGSITYVSGLITAVTPPT